MKPKKPTKSQPVTIDDFCGKPKGTFRKFVAQQAKANLKSQQRQKARAAMERARKAQGRLDQWLGLSQREERGFLRLSELNALRPLTKAQEAELAHLTRRRNGDYPYPAGNMPTEWMGDLP